MSYGPTACTVNTGRSFCRHHYSRQHRFLEDILVITKDQELIHVDMEPLHSMPAFHALSLEIHSSLGCPWWAPGHQCQGAPMVCQELMQQSLQHQNEEQWAKDSTLMHTKILHQTHHCTDGTIDPHLTLGLGVLALGDPHSPIFHPKAP